MTHQRHTKRSAETLSWYAFRVEPQKELLTSRLLKRKGLRCAVPCERKWRYPSKQAKAKRHREYRLKPLIPGSMWICFENGVRWDAVFKHDPKREFLKGVIGFGGVPARINTEQANQMLANQKAGVYTDSLLWRKMRTNAEYCVGDTVEIDAPGLDGLRGKVLSMNANEAKVLLPMFGSEREIEVPIDAAVKAA